MRLRLATLSLTGALVSIAANANQEQDVNYGDPTASFSTFGISRSGETTQVNGMYGAGNNIFQGDLNLADDGELSGRGRYFYVSEGLGYSADVIADRDTTTALGGLMYKFQVTDNIMLFPMLSAGYAENHKTKEGTGLAQAGVYAMYAFDSGHWLYANPKSTYLVKDEEWVDQVEFGGGYMVTDNISAGMKLEYTGETRRSREDTTFWLQGNVYF